MADRKRNLNEQENEMINMQKRGREQKLCDAVESAAVKDIKSS